MLCLAGRRNGVAGFDEVDVHVEDGFARTTIDQTYFNHNSWRMEGTFYFPLPPDASLSRLAMYVEDGDSSRLMEGGMAERDHARDALADRLARLGYPVAPTDVDVERLVDPLDWEAQGMERGTPFALAHRFRQTGPFRPGNVDRRFPGLVLCGSGTVPGVGIPMVLVSGKLAAARVAAREGRS